MLRSARRWWCRYPFETGSGLDDEEALWRRSDPGEPIQPPAYRPDHRPDVSALCMQEGNGCVAAQYAEVLGAPGVRGHAEQFRHLGIQEVRGKLRSPSKLDERLQDLRPAQVLANSPCVRPTTGTELVVRQDLKERGFEAIDVACWHGESQPSRFDEFGKGIAARRDDGQTSPEIVEDARAEGKLGFDVLEMCADADIGLQQVVLTLVVLDPTLIEEDVRSD